MFLAGKYYRSAQTPVVYPMLFVPGVLFPMIISWIKSAIGSDAGDKSVKMDKQSESCPNSNGHSNGSGANSSNGVIKKNGHSHVHEEHRNGSGSADCRHNLRKRL